MLGSRLRVNLCSYFEYGGRLEDFDKGRNTMHSRRLLEAKEVAEGHIIRI
jgi:hypothetical protein